MTSKAWPALALLALLGIFYPEVFLAKSASLMGDHWEQHYPWAFLMAKSLKEGILPFWTPLIQSGFPIVAESQMGLFYLPNLLLYLLLPFQWAYSYMNLVHFFIAGLGMYFYCRKMGLASVGAFVASVVFVFGTGYGGAFYNITSLKTLSWFPWILWAFEAFTRSFKKRYVLLASFFMALSILAGYLQVAALMLFVCAVYFLIRIFSFPETQQSWQKRFGAGGGMLLAALGAVILALPQLLLTFELAGFSNRVNLTEEYAYVGSLSPLALLTIVFPKLQGIFRGNCLYSGIFSIYFIVAAFFAGGKDLRRFLWLWVTMAAISLLLAFGGWSPLYIALIKLSHFYSFRVPAKFLIFFCFSAAVLAGLGAHVLCEELTKHKDRFQRLSRIYLSGVAGILLIWGGVYFFVTTGQSFALRVGRWVVENFIYGKSGHPRSFESYLESINGIINTVRDTLAITNPWQLWALALIAFTCVWVWVARRFLTRARAVPLLMTIAIGILIADLYVFAGIDIKRDFDSYENVFKQNIIVQTLFAEKDAGRVGRILGYRREAENLPLKPSVNMLYGIEDVGGYSPLILERYFETLGQFGNVNDSNQMFEATPDFVLERMPLLDSLDVSHIVAARELQHPDLELLARDPVMPAYLYRNRQEHARGYFIASAVSFSDWSILKEMLMASGFDPRKVLLLENHEKNKIRGIRLSADAKAKKIIRKHHNANSEHWFVETTGPGFFVLTNTFYPGWEAHINGQKAPILAAYGLFQTVWIGQAGKYSIEFTYQPYRGLLRCVQGKGCFIRGAGS